MLAEKRTWLRGCWMSPWEGMEKNRDCSGEHGSGWDCSFPQGRTERTFESLLLVAGFEQGKKKRQWLNSDVFGSD